MRRIAWIAPLLVVLACSGASTSSTTSGTSGTSDDAGTSSTVDASGVDNDATVPTDAGGTGTPTDAGTTPADGGAGDASVTPPKGAGQCFTDANCGTGKTCTATAPGGFCAGCAGSCNVGPADQCNFGTCNASCKIDGDCAKGLHCNSGGTCVLKACSGAGSCDPWHTCTGGFCRRVSCAAGETCPADTDCKVTSAGKLCVETFLTYP
jgi:hypothetical protein